MSVRNRIGFAILQLGQRCLDREMSQVVALATIVGQAWMRDNRSQVKAILSGDACLLPVPGALRGMIKEGTLDDEGSDQHRSMGFGTKP